MRLTRIVVTKGVSKLNRGEEACLKTMKIRAPGQASPNAEPTPAPGDQPKTGDEPIRVLSERI